MSSFVIANATFQIVKNAFSRNGNAAHQCFRVKNLQQEEVCELVRLWDALSAGTDLGLARLVVADDLNLRDMSQSSVSQSRITAITTIAA
jgi:hypothetical protein